MLVATPSGCMTGHQQQRRQQQHWDTDRWAVLDRNCLLCAVIAAMVARNAGPKVAAHASLSCSCSIVVAIAGCCSLVRPIRLLFVLRSCCCCMQLPVLERVVVSASRSVDARLMAVLRSTGEWDRHCSAVRRYLLLGQVSSM